MNVKNVKEYVKKANIYIKTIKQHPIETLTKKEINQTKKKYIKKVYIETCIKVCKNIYKYKC